VVVAEAIAVSTQTTAELWRFLLDIDWAAETVAALLPPDHPLVFLLAQPRAMRYRMGDGLWVRLVGVGAAVAGRTFPDDGELVLDVRDEFCPWNEGRWRVASGSAERTSAAPDLALDVATLGAAYLGGIAFTQLAQSGQIDELTPGGLERADRIFRHALHPWCPEIF